jgi:trimeric autotransporter adhesin
MASELATKNSEMLSANAAEALALARAGRGGGTNPEIKELESLVADAEKDDAYGPAAVSLRKQLKEVKTRGTKHELAVLFIEIGMSIKLLELREVSQFPVQTRILHGLSPLKHGVVPRKESELAMSTKSKKSSKKSSKSKDAKKQQKKRNSITSVFKNGVASLTRRDSEKAFGRLMDHMPSQDSYREGSMEEEGGGERVRVPSGEDPFETSLREEEEDGDAFMTSLGLPSLNKKESVKGEDDLLANMMGSKKKSRKLSKKMSSRTSSGGGDSSSSSSSSSDDDESSSSSSSSSGSDSGSDSDKDDDEKRRSSVMSKLPVLKELDAGSSSDSSDSEDNFSTGLISPKPSSGLKKGSLKNLFGTSNSSPKLFTTTSSMGEDTMMMGASANEKPISVETLVYESNPLSVNTSDTSRGRSVRNSRASRDSKEAASPTGKGKGGKGFKGPAVRKGGGGRGGSPPRPGVSAARSASPSPVSSPISSPVSSPTNSESSSTSPVSGGSGKGKGKGKGLPAKPLARGQSPARKDGGTAGPSLRPPSLSPARGVSPVRPNGDGPAVRPKPFPKASRMINSQSSLDDSPLSSSSNTPLGSIESMMSASQGMSKMAEAEL